MISEQVPRVDWLMSVVFRVKFLANSQNVQNHLRLMHGVTVCCVILLYAKTSVPTIPSRDTRQLSSICP